MEGRGAGGQLGATPPPGATHPPLRHKGPCAGHIQPRVGQGCPQLRGRQAPEVTAISPPLPRVPGPQALGPASFLPGELESEIIHRNSGPAGWLNQEAHIKRGWTPGPFRLLDKQGESVDLCPGATMETAQKTQLQWQLRPSHCRQDPVAGVRHSWAAWSLHLSGVLGGWGAHATAAVPAAHTPPPLAGPTLFRTAGCACWVEVRTRFLRPLCCGEGPGWLLSGLAGAQPVIQPLPAPPFPLLPAELPV